MITAIFVGLHEVRLAEPGLVSVQLQGDLGQAEVTEIMHIVGEHIAAREARLLIDVSRLGQIPLDWRHELDALKRVLESDTGPSRWVAFQGAHMLHKVVLSPLLGRTDGGQGRRLHARFFATRDEALVWLKLNPHALFAPDDVIYLTQVF